MAEAEGWTRTVVVLGGAALVVACMGAPLLVNPPKFSGPPTAEAVPEGRVTWPGNVAPLDGFPHGHSMTLECGVSNGKARVRLVLEKVTTAATVDVKMSIDRRTEHAYAGLPAVGGSVELPDAAEIAREIANSEDVYVQISSTNWGLSYVTADSKSRVERVLEQCWQ
jgi:hypothetical protein